MSLALLNVLYGLSGFAIAALIGRLLIPVMKAWRVMDQPNKASRKIHHNQIPLGGGIAIYVAFFLTILLLVPLSAQFFPRVLTLRQFFFMALGGLILIIGGIADDRFTLRAHWQILFPIAAAIIVIAGNIVPHVITNPWGGSLSLEGMSFFSPRASQLLLVANVLTFLWLMGMMLTTKILDGLDGLVTGIVAIGALLLFTLSQQPWWYQPEVGFLSILLFGTCLGFLVWNWHPAKIFLGEGGSLLTGYLLGVLAIVAGGKIAATFLVVGVPALDIIRVLIRRWQTGRPLLRGDREHLHFQLLHSGLSHRQAVLLLYSISFLFGVSVLFLQNRELVGALAFLLTLMLLIGVWFSRKK